MKVILDTDPGVDDAMAIAFCVAHPDIELLALTTVFGNTAVEQTTRNAQYLLDVFGAQDVVVVAGEAGPINGLAPNFADAVHGQDGLGNIYPPDFRPCPGRAHSTVQSMSAAEYIVEETRKAPGQITLAAVGPLTNIARALELDPTLAERVPRLVIMGGTVRERGNVSPFAEANFANDPEAADRCFAADWQRRQIGLDVTHRTMLTDGDLERLRDRAGAAGEVIWGSAQHYVRYYSEVGAARGADQPACAMHDVTAVAALVAPELFEMIYAQCGVIMMHGQTRGMLIVNTQSDDVAQKLWEARVATEIALGIDAPKMHALFFDTLLNHFGT